MAFAERPREGSTLWEERWMALAKGLKRSFAVPLFPERVEAVIQAAGAAAAQELARQAEKEAEHRAQESYRI